MPFILVVPSSVTPPTPTATGWPSLEHFYVDLAKQIGQYSRTTVAALAPGGEPGRWVKLDAFIDDEDGREKFGGGYVYVRSGAQTGSARRIRTTGFEGPYGALGLTRVLSVAGVPTNLAADVSVEVTKPLPVRAVGLTRGLVDLVNEALARIWTEIRIEITGNGTSLYSAADGDIPDWLVTNVQIDGIYIRPRGLATTVPFARSTIVPTITVNGSAITLETGAIYGTTETFQLKAFVMADKLVYNGSSWGYTATGSEGLTNDTDQAAVPVKWVTPIAMVKAIQYLRRMIAQNELLSLAEKKAKLAEIEETLHPATWAVAAYDVIETLLPRPQVAPVAALAESASDGRWCAWTEVATVPVTGLP